MATESVPTGLLEVGRVGKPHGVRGDLHVWFTTDREERWAVGSRLWIAGEWRVVSSSSARSDHHVCHFLGVDVRESAALLTNSLIYADPIEDSEALWVHELIGARVQESNGIDRGKCIAVLDNPAGPIMELESGALVPAVFVTKMVDGVATVDVPQGLFELGESDEN